MRVGKLFDKPVKTDGLSKAKILWVSGVLAFVVLSLVLYGVFAGVDKVSSEDKSMSQYNHAETSINDILAKVKHESAIASPRQSPVVTKSASQPVVVPPIVDNEEVQFKRQLRQNEQRQALKQIDSRYTSADSKTLMYSRIPNQTTSFATKYAENQSNSPVIESALSVNKRNPTQYLDSNIVEAKSPYELKAGGVIPASMINGINSDLAGEVIAFVRDNIYDSVSRKYLLIPQGARLVGLYDSNIAYGQKRVVVAWNRLIYPDGSSVDLKAMPGTDLEGYSGFYDLVDNKYWQIFGTSFIMGVITAGMQYSQNNTNANVQSGGIGYTNTSPSVGQTLSGSLGQQMGQTGLAVTQKNLNVAPTLIIRPGYPFNIMLTADLVLRPYNNAR